MATSDRADPILGDGILSKVSVAIYRWLVLALGTAAALLPLVLAMTWLAPVPRNIGWFLAACLPVAPAIAAGSHAALHWHQCDDLVPVRDLARGWRVGARGVIRWWLPLSAAASVLVVDVVWGDRVAGGQVTRLPAAVALVVLGLLTCHLVVITTSYDLRTRDAIKIALTTLVKHWRFTLYCLSLLVVLAALLIMGTPAVLMAVGWLFVLFLTHAGADLRTDVRRRFIAP